MGKIDFSLRDYHAINNADISIDGITVLSGINGCGKSTILRWLYYAMYGIKEFKSYAIKQYADNLLEVLQSDIDFGFDSPLELSDDFLEDSIKEKDNADFDGFEEPFFFVNSRTNWVILTRNSRYKLIDKVYSIVLSHGVDIEASVKELDNILSSALDYIKKTLLLLNSKGEKLDVLQHYQARMCYQALAYIDEKQLSSLVELIPNIINGAKQSDTQSKKQLVQDYFEKNLDIQNLNKVIDFFFLKKKEYAKNVVFSNDYELFSFLVKRKYSELDELPKKFSISEFGTKIFSSTAEPFKSFSIDNVFYIDSPIIIGEYYGFKRSDYVWRVNLLKSITKNYVSDYKVDCIANLLSKIKDTVHGYVTVPHKRESNFFRRGRLLEFKNFQGEFFDIKKVATGIKSFSYLQKLIENGLLNEKTLLLIDEPEAHLHPQWIVTFAYLLVLLQKNLNVSIVLSSHSPDMIQSIQEIAVNEGIEKKTRFYLAQASSLDLNGKKISYNFVDQGGEVDKIFENFNKAFYNLEALTSENS